MNSSFSLSAFQPFCDDYVASSSEITGGAPKPKEIPCSEARTSNSSGNISEGSIEADFLRKEIKALKAQCLTAIAQSKNSSEHEEAALLQTKEATESAQIAAVKLTQAIDRESYILELMTTVSQDLIGRILREPPSQVFFGEFFW